MKQSPRNTASSPLSRSHVPLNKRHFIKSKRSQRRLSFPLKHLVRRKPLPMREKRNLLYLCHLRRGTSDLLVAPKRCFEGFVSSRNSLLIHFIPLSRLFAILAPVRPENSG